jgi:flagellar motor switch protein FliN
VTEEGGNEMELDETPPVEDVLLEEMGVDAPVTPLRAGGQAEDLSLVLDVPVELAVEIGRTRMTIRETLALAPGSIVTLDRMAGEPVDLLVNGRRIARGEVVAVDEEFGFRITELLGAAQIGAAAA